MEKVQFDAIFRGSFHQEVKCVNCEHVSEKSDPFLDISVDISGSNTILQALHNYFRDSSLDVLGGSQYNMYQCQKCHQMVPANWKCSIEETPDVLCVHFKRFTKFGKNNKKMNISRCINLRPLLKSKRDANYTLQSLVSHHGPGVGAGHYTAMVDNGSGQFYHFNDGTRTAISLQNFLEKGDSYIVFYERDVGLTESPQAIPRHQETTADISKLQESQTIKPQTNPKGK